MIDYLPSNKPNNSINIRSPRQMEHINKTEKALLQDIKENNKQEQQKEEEGNTKGISVSEKKK
jgi:hypothetical protein